MTVRFVLACLLQVGLVAALAFVNTAVLAGGTAVTLPIEPIDPRDPLRGDYVTFRYRISNLDLALFGTQRPVPGQLVYVVLARSAAGWDAIRVELTPPERAEVFLRGRIEVVPATPEGRVRVVYGIEQYFIPEGRGRGFDPRGREVAAHVVVDRGGGAVVTALSIDGRRWP